MREIIYLSQPAPVNMGDHWFEIANIDHFWVRRRFEVFQCLAGSLISNAREIAEIGCGHGLLQCQVENAFGRDVSGFDLNAEVLKQNLSERSPLFCYNVSHKNKALQARFDLIFLFDVLEHLEEEDGFLQAAAFHLASQGSLLVNVPAGQWMYSKYDEAVGHKQRYSIGTLRAVAIRNGMQVANWCYWGIPLIPLLIARRLWPTHGHNDAEIISAGFDSRGDALNRLLLWISRCELTPQRLFGTSLMAVLQPQTQPPDSRL